MKQGNVEIILPKEEVVTICFTQVGMMENGEFVLELPFEKSGINLNTLRTAQQLEAAAKKLEPYVTDGFLVETDLEGVAKIESLDEGVYLLNSMETESKEMILPTLLFLPTWDEIEGEMLYDVTVIPKYGESGPKTGDTASALGWILVLVLSVMIFLIKMKKILKKEDCF